MEDVLINQYHKGKIIDKVLLITSLVLFVMGLTVYAMSAFIPSNLMHPNDYYNSIDYIDMILLVLRIASCILVLISIILVFIVRLCSVLKKHNKGIDVILSIIIYIFFFVLSVLIFWLMNDSWALGYSITVYYCLFPVSLFLFGLLISKTNPKILWTFVLFFSLIVLFHYHLTFGISNLHIQYEYILFGLLPGLLGTACGVLIRKYVKKMKS